MTSIATKRRHLLIAGGAMGLAGAVGLQPRTAHSATPLNLWLQAQWWSPEYEAACLKSTGIEVRNAPTKNSSTTLSKMMAGGGADGYIVQITNPFVPPLERLSCPPTSAAVAFCVSFAAELHPPAVALHPWRPCNEVSVPQ